ncbi:MAG: hypothetical protein A3F41_01615 [Coxiella sp. RIFCSPHIGHO2_12_FULL_44_14]|nr:MAG: hypothetical protein A3F41_01615 [Coxiella sp. RIFCSPHIGHO2_12_FULL_44_14]
MLNRLKRFFIFLLLSSYTMLGYGGPACALNSDKVGVGTTQVKVTNKTSNNLKLTSPTNTNYVYDSWGNVDGSRGLLPGQSAYIVACGGAGGNSGDYIKLSDSKGKEIISVWFSTTSSEGKVKDKVCNAGANSINTCSQVNGPDNNQAQYCECTINYSGSQ